MRLVIGSTTYDLEATIGEAAIGDLYHLKLKLGVSVKTINLMFKEIGKKAQEPDFTAMDLLDNLDLLLNLQGLVWLARRQAGEKVTLEEAGAIPFKDLSFETDDEEEPATEDEVDPKVQGSSPAVESLSPNQNWA